MMLTRDLLEALLKFRQEREWERFHTPKNLSAAIVVEAAELLECFQWTADSDLETLLTDEREAIEHEVADIAILLPISAMTWVLTLTRLYRENLS